MSTHIRHVLPSSGHFAAYVLRKAPYGLIIPLIDRVLVQREVNGERVDEIVGTVISETKYKIADEVGPDTKFVGYVDPQWLTAKGINMQAYEQELVGYGKQWESREHPRILPAALQDIIPDAEYDEPEESRPLPPRARRGR